MRDILAMFARQETVPLLVSLLLIKPVNFDSFPNYSMDMLPDSHNNVNRKQTLAS
jgi:hypothetical protein